MSGRQGIPDDLKPTDELPLDVPGALAAIMGRLLTLQEELKRTRTELVRLCNAIEERRRHE